jgi:hypothetical protein
MPYPTLLLQSFAHLEEKEKELIHLYLESLDELHRKALLIAFEHLGSSFNILRSNGYKDWKLSKA